MMLGAGSAMGGGGMGVAQTHVAQPHDMGAGSATLPGAAGGMKVEGGKGEPTGEDSDEQAEEQVPVLVGGSRQYSSGVLATQDPTQDPWRSEPLVLPSYAAWFRLDAVHPIERRALPKILSDSDEATAAYMELRNGVVNLYRDCPHRVLTASDCLHHIPRRADQIFLVHGFLAHWGIINTEADARIRYAKAMRALAPMVPSIPAFDDWSEDETRRLFDALHRFSLTTYQRPEDETLRLFDALQRCGDEWDVVSHLVGGKSMDQCVRHFISLPISDLYVSDAFARRGDEEERVLRCASDSTGERAGGEGVEKRGGASSRSDQEERALRSAGGAVPPRGLSDQGCPLLSSQLRAMLSADFPDPEAGRAALQAALAVLDRHEGADPPPDPASEAGPSPSSGTPVPSGTPPIPAKWAAALHWPPAGAAGGAGGGEAARGEDGSKTGRARPETGDLVLVLAPEVGGCVRARVDAVHGRRSGVDFVDVRVVGALRAETMQLGRGEIRVLSGKEVAAVEEALGRTFMDAAGEEEQGGLQVPSGGAPPHPQALDMQTCSVMDFQGGSPLLKGPRRALAAAQAAAALACGAARESEEACETAVPPLDAPKRARSEEGGALGGGESSGGGRGGGGLPERLLDDAEVATAAWKRTKLAHVRGVLEAGVARTVARVAAFETADALLEHARDALAARD
ncbi:hypothetical protein T484DRAFT_1907878 [Baffinella frigidus]|nr:hypothetical protein T484DRAFT_1907878 [Cryptophyta sp. CCMP2293]